MVKPYQSNLEHIQEEMALLDLRLLHAVETSRQRKAMTADEGFLGLLISEAEIDAILLGLDRPEEGPPEEQSEESEAAPLLLELARRRQCLEARRPQGMMEGGPVRLERLRGLFGLSDFDLGTIAVCLAPELDLKYEQIYGYLQDDVGKKRPTINLVLNLLCDDIAQRVELRRAFAYPSALLKYQLAYLGEDTYSKDSSLLSRSVALEARVVDYLLGFDTIDHRLRQFAWKSRPSISWEEVVLPDPVRVQLEEFTDSFERVFAGERGSVVLQLIGPAGNGKKTVARAMCRSLGKGLLVVDCAGLLSSDLPAETLTTLVIREARLQDAVLCLDGFQSLLGDEARERAIRNCLAGSLEELAGVTIIAGEAPWRFGEGSGEVSGESAGEGSAKQSLVTVEMPRPEYPERKLLWQIHLKGQEAQLSEDDLTSLVSKFRFNGGQISRAVATAQDLARWRSVEEGGITSEDLHAAARWHSNQRLETMAQKIQPRYSWDDIVLPADQKQQLREVCDCFKNMPLVYGEWGFQSKTSLGKGLNVLFAGPSGTGKTMSAEIMSGELGLDLYKIDLSTIVSKYIGETEKNLDRIFHEAQDSNAILFFDEADAIFGKRSEVRDAHDRYANIEVSYLLQKMEEYQGITILTTNFRKNMDDAFVRRLHFAVEFPFPEEESRLQIWERVFPREAPLKDTVDLQFSARQFKLAGGNIKNIAVAAAFLGAREGGGIGMEHLIRATRREYQKMGKLLVESDFGRYFDLVRGGEGGYQTRVD